VSTGEHDLFVVCKNCGSEVSPYITECPYCGNRLRKRAPKLDRHGRLAERLSRQPAQLPRLRRGEIPGIRADAHPYCTILLVLLGIAGCLVWRTDAVSVLQLVVQGPLHQHAWRLFTAPFVYTNSGYAFLALSAIALYGTLLERRHGAVVVAVVFLLGAVGGAGATVDLASSHLALGGVGGALALLVAWAVPDLLALSSRREVDGDLIGTGVFAAALLLMPLAVADASWLSDATGVLAGIVIGYPLARIHPV
jgi:membrane associated rhomboid family serine protease